MLEICEARRLRKWFFAERAKVPSVKFFFSPRIFREIDLFEVDLLALHVLFTVFSSDKKRESINSFCHCIFAVQSLIPTVCHINKAFNLVNPLLIS